jgi:hypothetical protein
MDEAAANEAIQRSMVEEIHRRQQVVLKEPRDARALLTV